MYFITHFIVYKKINAKSLNNNMIQKKLDEKMMFQNKLTLGKRCFYDKNKLFGVRYLLFQKGVGVCHRLSR